MSGQQQQKNVAQAEEHVRLAEKALKTSLTKWTADHDSAADSYAKAATCYKVAKSYNKSIEVALLASEHYRLSNSLYHAAKQLENAILISRDANTVDRVLDLAQKAALLYRQHGSAESAAHLLDKAAKILDADPDRLGQALDLYRKAADTVATEGRNKEAAEYWSKVARLQTKMGQLDDATESLTTSIEMLNDEGYNADALAGRLVLASILIHICRQDPIQADKVFQQCGGLCDPSQTATCRSLVQGATSLDKECVITALRSAPVKNLDVEFQRLAKDAADKMQATLAKTASNSDSNATGPADDGGDDDNDDDIGGLC